MARVCRGGRLGVLPAVGWATARSTFRRLPASRVPGVRISPFAGVKSSDRVTAPDPFCGATMSTDPQPTTISNRQIWCFALLAALGCGVDLVTKHWIFAWPAVNPPGRIHWIWEPHVGLQLSLNEGALFGMGAGYVALFVALSVIAMLAIPYWLFALGAATDTICLTAMGLVMGGILGNLYDRLGLHGLKWANPPEREGETVYAVRDFVLLQWNDSWRWPNFNVADSLLVCGAALLCLYALVAPSDAPAASDEKTNA